MGQKTLTIDSFKKDPRFKISKLGFPHFVVLPKRPRFFRAALLTGELRFSTAVGTLFGCRFYSSIK